MAPKLTKGRTLRSALPDGYAFVVLKYLQDFESGTKTSLFSDAEEDEIYKWLNEDTPDVPDGWFPPDAWRCCQLLLDKLNLFNNKILKLTPQLGKLTGAKEINLSANKVMKIDAPVIQGWGGAEIFNMFDCRLLVLPSLGHLQVTHARESRGHPPIVKSCSVRPCEPAV